MAVKETKNDFSQGSVPKLIWKLAVPMIVAQVVNALYSIVDRVYIGHMAGVGQLALTGIGLCFPITMTVAAFSALIGYGGAPLSSILRGRKDADGAERVLGNSVSALCVLGILIPLACFFLRRPVLYLFGASDATFPYADQYITIYLTGSLPVMLTLGLNAFINAQGFTRDGMVTVGVGAVLNLALDPLFIFAFHMGIAGAAVATVIGNVCADVFFVWVTYKKSHQLSFSPKLCHVTKKQMGQIMVIGIPASITNLMQSVGVMLMNRYLLPYGSDCIAAMGIVLKITMIAILILVGFSFGAQPLFGYHYGAGNTRRLWKILRFAYGFEGALALGLTVVLALLAPQLTSLFLKDQALVGMATEMLQWQVSSMVFVAIGLVTTCLFQSMGKALGAFLLSISRQGVLFALAVAVGSAVGGYTGVIVAQPAADVLTALLAVAFVVTVIASERKKLVLGE